MIEPKSTLTAAVTIKHERCTKIERKQTFGPTKLNPHCVGGDCNTTETKRRQQPRGAPTAKVERQT